MLSPFARRTQSEVSAKASSIFGAMRINGFFYPPDHNRLLAAKQSKKERAALATHNRPRTFRGTVTRPGKQ